MQCSCCFLLQFNIPSQFLSINPINCCYQFRLQLRHLSQLSSQKLLSKAVFGLSAKQLDRMGIANLGLSVVCMNERFTGLRVKLRGWGLGLSCRALVSVCNAACKCLDLILKYTSFDVLG